MLLNGKTGRLYARSSGEGSTGDPISILVLRTVTEVSLSDSTYQIIRYRISKSRAGIYTMHNVKGNKISWEMQSIFRKPTSGDQILIYNAAAVGARGDTVSVQQALWEVIP